MKGARPDMTRSARRMNERGFALITVFWLAGIGFLCSMIAAGFIMHRTRSVAAARRSFETTLALDEVCRQLEEKPGFLPRGWESVRDTTITVGKPDREYRVRVRRWGLWAVAEISLPQAGQNTSLSRIVLAGERRPQPGSVLYVRSNRMPLVLAHEADIRGSVVVADSIMIRPWKGRHFAQPRPAYIRGANGFENCDIWDGFREAIRRWEENPEALPPSIALYPSSVTLSRIPESRDGDPVHTVIVLGELCLQGDWGLSPVCVYAREGVVIEAGSRIIGQILSERAISISESHLDWPSLVMAGNRGWRGESVLSLHDGSVVEGMVGVIHEPGWSAILDQETSGLVFVDPSSSVRGAIYVQGSLQMLGSLQGWAEIGETFEHEPPTTYHNWILHGRWQALGQRDPLPLFPLALTHQEYQTTVVEGLR